MRARLGMPLYADDHWGRDFFFLGLGAASGVIERECSFVLLLMWRQQDAVLIIFWLSCFPSVIGGILLLNGDFICPLE